MIPVIGGLSAFVLTQLPDILMVPLVEPREFNQALPFDVPFTISNRSKSTLHEFSAQCMIFEKDWGLGRHVIDSTMNHPDTKPRFEPGDVMTANCHENTQFVLPGLRRSIIGVVLRYKLFGFPRTREYRFEAVIEGDGDIIGWLPQSGPRTSARN